MSSYIDVLLYKIAPLCPTLARKLRLVCKRFAQELATTTPTYRERCAIYRAPLQWPEHVLLNYFPLYGKDQRNIFCTNEVDIISFLRLVFPHILHEENTRVSPIGISSNGPVFECYWYYGMPIEEGPTLFCNRCDTKECQLECSYNTCFAGPRLGWAWSIRIDTVRMLFFISKVPIPSNYVKPLPTPNPYNRSTKKCKLCK